MMYLILMAGVMNLFVGLLTVRRGEKNRELVSFSIFSVVTSLWIFLNFLMYYSDSTFFLKPVYAVGSLTAGSVLAWAFLNDRRIKKYWKASLIYLSAIFMAVFSMINGYVIKDVTAISFSGVSAVEGDFFYLWGVYTMGSILWAIGKTYAVYRSSKGVRKKQLRLLLWGISGFGGVSILVSVILPAVGIFFLTNLDSPSSLIFVIFSSVAITRHTFLGKKVMFSNFLVISLLSISLVMLLNSRDTYEISIRILLFIVILLVGVILLESVSRETEQREQLSKMVDELSRANTKLKELSDKIKKANEELKKADKQKTEFLSIASHQLRSPLSIIKGYLGLVLDGNYGELNDGLNDVCRRSYNSADRMLRLVSDFLNLSRLEAGRIEYEFESIQVEEIIQDVIINFKPKAEERGLKIKHKIPEEALPVINADKQKIMEVLINLVDNSIKYTKEGEINVNLSKEKNNLLIEVADTGTGISKEDIDKMFTKFSRGSNRKDKASGTGLGLFISKKFIEAHKGKIWVESEGEGEGAHFFIRLPIK